MKSFLRDDTLVTLSKALDALSLRHEVISDNIANANTPGFKARAVSFEKELKAALSRGKPGSARPGVYEDRLRITPDGNSVDIDLEMAKLAETTIVYGALTRLVSNKFELLKSVISEGRR